MSSSVGSQNYKTLILVHPIGGTCLGYRILLQQVDRPIELIDDPALESTLSEGKYDKTSRYAFQSVTEQAKYLVSHLHKKAPPPYLLGGHSSGGVVALEMARILKDRCQEVSHVYLFDSWAQNPPFTQDEQKFRAYIKQGRNDPILDAISELAWERMNPGLKAWD